MTTRIAVVVGNPSPGSRTRQVAEDLAARIAVVTGSEVDETIELAEVTDEIFEWKSDRLDKLTERLATADYAVIATPTYKASYTGLLKAFLDRYDAGGLHGLTAIPVFTIGSPAHALAVETTLRPLLVELGASVPTKGLAFPTAKFDDRAAILDEWIATQGNYLPRGNWLKSPAW
jgi:FMN reductase